MVRDRRGMAAVEFAMVFLLMMTWIFGIMEVARAFWTYQIIQEVAVQGARCMGIISTNCSVGGAYDQTTSQNYMVALAGNLGLVLPVADIVVARPTNCAGTAGFSQVSINYNFTTKMPVLIPSLSTVPLTASSCAYDTR